MPAMEEPTNELERRYRRLLRWYPRAFRKDVGAELVTTLLDAAEPGQRRPSRRAVADLVKGGLRQRFRLPIGIAPRVVAVLAALVVGAMGAAAGGWSAWLTSPGLPGDAEAKQIIGTAMGVPYDHGLNRSVGLLGGLVPPESSSPAYVGNAESRDVPGSTTDVVARRLTAAGWKIRPAADPPLGSAGPALSASRDGLVIWVRWMDIPASAEPPRTFLSIEIVQDEPALAPAGLTAGWLIGALGGWLFAAATIYRIRRQGLVVQVLAALLTTGALALFLLPTLVAYLGLWSLGQPERYLQPPWAGYVLSPLHWLTLLGLAATTTLIALSLIRPGKAAATAPGPQPAG
ncbi:hypothetical protein ACFPIJ_33980 [Dactylosporangium cerinum]|uniref:Integral membrane protein n=1 Tax=Dactylosporangium cerinum TaxID=1434730 RepID=A0ABV9W4P5_9ACTN